MVELNEMRDCLQKIINEEFKGVFDFNILMSDKSIVETPNFAIIDRRGDSSRLILNVPYVLFDRHSHEERLRSFIRMAIANAIIVD